MSEAEAEEEEPETDDQPEIEDDEMADFSAVAEEMGDPDEDDEKTESEEEGKSDDSSDETRLSTTDRVSVGDVYCNALGMGAAVSRARYGTADEEERAELVDEYSEMAKDLQIDEYVNQWLEENGGIDELSPGQAILFSTMLYGGLVVMDDPEMLDNIASEVAA